MKSNNIKKEILLINREWELLSTETSEDEESFHFISIKASALSMRVHNFHKMITSQIEEDKKYKLKFQKLTSALEKVEKLLNFKLVIKNRLNQDHINSILSKIRAIEPEINTLKSYLKD